VRLTAHAGFGGRPPGKGPGSRNRTRDLARRPTLLLPFEAYDAELRLCHPRRDLGRPPSAMRPWAPGFGVRAVRRPWWTGHGRARTSLRTGTDQPTAEARKATDGADGSSYTHRPPRFFPLTWHFRMPEHYRRLLVTGLGLAGLLARLADSAALPSVYRQSHDLVD
jgi:hypothetical protein